MKVLEKSLVLLMSALLAGAFSVPALAKHRHHHTFTIHSEAAEIGTIHGQDQLISAIRRAVSFPDDDAAIGVQIRSMKTGNTLYSLNEHHMFSPASTMKIFTAEAALISLGPDFQFTTRVLTDAKNANNGLLAGNIWLVQSGDPSLTYYDMTDLMVALKSEQISGIQGNVYLDNSAYDQNNIGPGWLWKDRQYFYAAPINASIINHNFVSFSILPAKKRNQTALIVKSPRYFYAPIHNTVVTRSHSARSCHVSVSIDQDNTINLDGCLPQGHYSRSATVVIHDVATYTRSLLQHLFKRAGIHVAGNIQNQNAPSGLFLLATHESKPLHILINDMLKKSDNQIAGSLFKKLGEIHTNTPGSWENGRLAVNDILKEYVSIDPSQLKIVDGSGLSPQNQTTPEQLMRVLTFAFHNERTSYEFISALPIAGLDGTLKHRLKHISGKVRAKTGSLSDQGVSALAGYAITKDREPIAFVILVNGRKGNVWKYREMEDQIATALAHFTR
ncbi:MAG: D-alanyl-D-alanine carboxypeptidase/D-alanyl-D-alanine-endopeptidase [Gammaproteobacteria bacterium]|nr:D-alanyl-D-alanine carboxypeptidase/D-alanyl-D-alanine-endopeptidase [Gammaproteobacteria bacterium]